MGDISLYHVYLESYIQLFQGQRDVYHVETKTEIPIGELGLAEAERENVVLGINTTGICISMQMGMKNRKWC